MIDSVVWSYCRTAVYEVIASEANIDVNARISEIQVKISNLAAKIREYDTNKMIKAEDAILRNKMKILVFFNNFEPFNKLYLLLI